MPPKKKPKKELLAEGSSQAAREQVPATAQTATQTTHIPQTFHLQSSASLHPIPTNSTEQPPAQAEVLGLNTFTPNTMPPPPPTPQAQESSQQNTNFPTFKTIHMITRGSNLNFENKRQKREHYRQAKKHGYGYRYQIRYVSDTQFCKTPIRGYGSNILIIIKIDQIGCFV
jgi:hypothetical protein